MGNIPLCRIDTNEVLYSISEVLYSGKFILGDQTDSFEKEFASYIGTKHAVAVSSGTAGLMLVAAARLAMGIGPVPTLVPSLTFYATVTGAYNIRFGDVDKYRCLDVGDTVGTVGCIPVHLYGHPADMDKILGKYDKSNIIEDCCQAHGAEYKGKKVGTFGSCGVFSFFPSKVMTVCGDGGMIVTDDDVLADLLRAYRNQGRVKGSKYEHKYVAGNFRMSEIHAAIGRIQLGKLDKYIAARRHIANQYNELFESHNLTKFINLPPESKDVKSVYYTYTIEALERDKLSNHLKEQGIQTGIYYPIPVHRQPLYRQDVLLPETDRLSDVILSLPMYPGLRDEEIVRVVNCMEGFYHGK